MEGRLAAFDLVQNTKHGDVITLHASRDGADRTMQYKITTIKQKKVLPFGTGPDVDQKAIDANVFTLSKEQKYASNKREFKAAHKKPEQEETNTEIKNRLLDNLKKRRTSRRER
jgi:hypothetical protein